MLTKTNEYQIRQNNNWHLQYKNKKKLVRKGGLIYF